MKRGGEEGAENNVKNFAPLWFGIVYEETGCRSTTTQSADSMKGEIRSEGEAVALVVGDDDIDMLLFRGGRRSRSAVLIAILCSEGCVVGCGVGCGVELDEAKRYQ